jgi:hypothetical protein
VPPIFSQFSLKVQVILSETFIGPRCGIDQPWFLRIELIEHLEASIWTFELEHALEVFSLSTYLNWFDYDFKEDVDHFHWYGHFPVEFLHYLECQVSKPCSQTIVELQLLILIRENLTFITTICYVT